MEGMARRTPNRDTDEKPVGNRSRPLVVSVTVIAFLAVYVLSIGPAAMLADKTNSNFLTAIVGFFYSPLLFLPDWARAPIKDYVNWWRD
jgi:hypothetical protein